MRPDCFAWQWVHEPRHSLASATIALRFHKVGSTNFREALTQVLQPSYMEHETLAAYKAGGLARYALLIEAPLVLHTALSSSGFDSLKQLAVHGRSKGASCCLHRPAA